MSCSMRLSKNCAKWNYFNSNLCWMLEDVLIKGLLPRILVFRVWPWFSTWIIRERQSCTQKNRLQVAKQDESYIVFFMQLTRTYALVLKLVAESRATWVPFLVSAEFLCCTSALAFCWHWARQCTDIRAFYIAALSILSFFLDFGSGNLALRVVNLNTTIRHPLFWRTWAGQHSPTCAGLAHGQRL